MPWHTEVAQFSEQLCAVIGTFDGGISYGIACEHEHSCCLLLVRARELERERARADLLLQARRDRFFRDGAWCTWIDFDRFLELAKAGKPFTSADCAHDTRARASPG